VSLCVFVAPAPSASTFILSFEFLFNRRNDVFGSASAVERKQGKGRALKTAQIVKLIFFA
jgi:hypothetical protein